MKISSLARFLHTRAVFFTLKKYHYTTKKVLKSLQSWKVFSIFAIESNTKISPFTYIDRRLFATK